MKQRVKYYKHAEVLQVDWSAINHGEQGRYKTYKTTVNSLAPGRSEKKFRQLIFKLILVIERWIISCYIALNWMSLGLT